MPHQVISQTLTSRNIGLLRFWRPVDRVAGVSDRDRASGGNGCDLCWRPDRAKTCALHPSSFTLPPYPRLCLPTHHAQVLPQQPIINFKDLIGNLLIRPHEVEAVITPANGCRCAPPACSVRRQTYSGGGAFKNIKPVTSVGPVFNCHQSMAIPGRRASQATASHSRAKLDRPNGPKQHRRG